MADRPIRLKAISKNLRLLKKEISLYSRLVKNKLAVESLTTELEKGEAEAIILALELNANLVLIDESIARDIAKSRELEVIGTVWILAGAYEKGVINDLKKVLDDLRNKKVWISEKVCNRVLNGTNRK